MERRKERWSFCYKKIVYLTLHVPKQSELYRAPTLKLHNKMGKG